MARLKVNPLILHTKQDANQSTTVKATLISTAEPITINLTEAQAHAK